MELGSVGKLLSGGSWWTVEGRRPWCSFDRAHRGTPPVFQSRPDTVSPARWRVALRTAPPHLRIRGIERGRAGECRARVRSVRCARRKRFRRVEGRTGQQGDADVRRWDVASARRTGRAFASVRPRRRAQWLAFVALPAPAGASAGREDRRRPARARADVSSQRWSVMTEPLRSIVLVVVVLFVLLTVAGLLVWFERRLL